MRRLVSWAGVILLSFGLFHVASFAARLTNQLPHSDTRDGLLRTREIQALEVQQFLKQWSTEDDRGAQQAQQLKKLHTRTLNAPGSTRPERTYALESIAQAALDQGDLVSAEQNAQAALKEQPKLPIASAVLVSLASRQANAALQQARPEEAKGIYESVLKLALHDDWRVLASIRLADVLEQSGMPQEALKICMSIEENAGNLPDWKAFAVLREAKLYAKLGDREMADRTIARLKKEYPYSPWSRADAIFVPPAEALVAETTDAFFETDPVAETVAQ